MLGRALSLRSQERNRSRLVDDRSGGRRQTRILRSGDAREIRRCPKDPIAIDRRQGSRDPHGCQVVPRILSRGRCPADFPAVVPIRTRTVELLLMLSLFALVIWWFVTWDRRGEKTFTLFGWRFCCVRIRWLPPAFGIALLCDAALHRDRNSARSLLLGIVVFDLPQ
jgi:hypothetical protein